MFSSGYLMYLSEAFFGAQRIISSSSNKIALQKLHAGDFFHVALRIPKNHEASWFRVEKTLYFATGCFKRVLQNDRHFGGGRIQDS